MRGGGRTKSRGNTKIKIQKEKYKGFDFIPSLCCDAKVPPGGDEVGDGAVQPTKRSLAARPRASGMVPRRLRRARARGKTVLPL